MSTYGAAGRLAAAFIDSKLTPLFILASMALGALAVVALPREEEPQIIVPMVDVFVEMPGASPADVEGRVTRPLEQLLWEVPGVEYVYSTSSPGQAMVIVRFKVGEPEEAALVRLNQKLAANADRIPPGVIGPLVKPRSIDDVPILAVTLWSDRYGDDQLRALAAQLRDSIAEVDEYLAERLLHLCLAAAITARLIALEVARQVTVLHYGRVIADGTREVVRADPTVGGARTTPGFWSAFGTTVRGKRRDTSRPSLTFATISSTQLSDQS